MADNQFFSPETPSDQELIIKIKEDVENLGLLMARYEGPLSGYLRKAFQLGREDGEDILQEVFIKIYKNINDYDPRLKFSSWLYRIARNQAIDHLRKQNRRPYVIGLEDADLDKILHLAADIGKDIENREVLDKIRGIIGALPEKYREVLVLRFLEEKDYQEIMDILKKPKGTVATRIDRGRKMLLEELRRNNFI